MPASITSSIKRDNDSVFCMYRTRDKFVKMVITHDSSKCMNVLIDDLWAQHVMIRNPSLLSMLVKCLKRRSWKCSVILLGAYIRSGNGIRCVPLKTMQLILESHNERLFRMLLKYEVPLTYEKLLGVRNDVNASSLRWSMFAANYGYVRGLEVARVSRRSIYYCIGRHHNDCVEYLLTIPEMECFLTENISIHYYPGYASRCSIESRTLVINNNVEGLRLLLNRLGAKGLPCSGSVGPGCMVHCGDCSIDMCNLILEYGTEAYIKRILNWNAYFERAIYASLSVMPYGAHVTRNCTMCILALNQKKTPQRNIVNNLEFHDTFLVCLRRPHESR